MVDHTIEAHFKVESGVGVGTVGADAQSAAQAEWDAQCIASMAEAARGVFPEIPDSFIQEQARATYVMIRALATLQMERVKAAQLEAYEAHRKAAADYAAASGGADSGIDAGGGGCGGGSLAGTGSAEVRKATYADQVAAEDAKLAPGAPLVVGLKQDE